MRYRLTFISVVVTALAAAALVFVLNQGDSSSPEITQPDLFPEGGLGIVAAFTATAQAGGAALDPTALAKPTSTPRSSDATPASTSTASDASATTISSSPVIDLSTDEAKTGDQITVSVSGAAAGESFELTIGGVPIETSSSTADATGHIQIEITVPGGVSGDSVELVLNGSVSGSTSATITVSANLASISVSPEQPESGESVTVSAEGFEPGEAVTISVSGKEIGSGFAGQDGSFSMTTGLPELPQSADEPQFLSANGAEGSSASADFVAPDQPAGSGPGSPGAPGGSPGNASDDEELASDLDGLQEGEKAANADALPTWVYIVIGAMAGWIGVLTVWVYRLDRDRESQYRLLRHVISDLVGTREQKHDSSSGEDETDSDGESKAA